jgi:4-hydroxybenzoate polyprenyltransferase
MFRSNRLLWGPTRRTKGWRNEKGSVTARHFIKTIYGKKLDVQMVGGETGMSHGANSSARVSNNILLRIFNMASLASLGPVGAWLQAVRFAEWRGIAHLYYPCLWGVGFGTTKVLVLEAADMVVLNMPLLPVHLVLQFFVAAWSAQCAALLAAEWCDRVVSKKPPKIDMSTKALTVAMLGQGTVSFLIVSNMHYLAPVTMIAAAPLALAYPVVWRLVDAHQGKARTLLRQLHRGVLTNLGVVMGYAAVVGRVDPTAVVPIFCAGVMWTLMYDSLELLTRDEQQVSLRAVPLLFKDMKVYMAILLPNIFTALCATAFATGQSFVFVAAAGGVAAHLYWLLDHMNLGDSWSVATTSKRLTRFGLLVVLSIMAGNAFWVFGFTILEQRPAGADAQEPTLSPLTSSTLGKVLAMNAVPAQRYIDEETGRISFLERLAKPALVHKEILRQQRIAQGPKVPEPTEPQDAKSDGGDHRALVNSGAPSSEVVDDARMPAYMRREFIVENFVSLARYCIPAERLAMYERWWYGFADHYTVLGGG